MKSQDYRTIFIGLSAFVAFAIAACAKPEKPHHDNVSVTSTTDTTTTAAAPDAPNDAGSGAYVMRQLGSTTVDGQGSNDFGIFTDPKNQCQYIVFNGVQMGGITPRLDASHQQICGPTTD